MLYLCGKQARPRTLVGIFDPSRSNVNRDAVKPLFFNLNHTKEGDLYRHSGAQSGSFFPCPCLLQVPNQHPSHSLSVTLNWEGQAACQCRAFLFQKRTFHLSPLLPFVSSGICPKYLNVSKYLVETLDALYFRVPSK